MTEDKKEQNQVEETKEIIIGDFTPKRKFLNFVSAINGRRIRILSDIAFIKGDKLSGLGLDNVVFKITICDEGTIRFEETDTNVTDYACRKRLIDDISSMDVTGYAQKFVVSDLEFADKDGGRCYLEVEEKKPIDKLKSLFDEMDNTKEISEKGLSFLDELLGNSVTEDIIILETENETKTDTSSEPIEKSATTMMEESFRKMNEDKINELKSRVEDKESEIKKAKVEISHAEAKIKSSSDELQVLNTRLESLSPGDEPNGYVFFVTEEQKNETGLDDSSKDIADKIADLMKLKKDVLFDYLTGGFYKIKIGKKGENDKKGFDIYDNDILEKVYSIDPLGKLTMTDTNEFEYRGELNWHQLTGKMIRKGFEQDPEFNKISGSNSYESKEEIKEEDKIKGSIEEMAKKIGMEVKFGEDGIELIEKDENKN